MVYYNVIESCCSTVQFGACTTRGHYVVDAPGTMLGRWCNALCYSMIQLERRTYPDVLLRNRFRLPSTVALLV